jgi:nickel transport protein
MRLLSTPVALPPVLRAGLTALPLGLVVLVSAGPGHCHAIESSLERIQALNSAFSQEELLLESRFGSGEPARQATVRLLPPGGQPVEIGRTDSAGQLRFSLPRGAAQDWEVQVDAGPGHRDYLELTEAGSTGMEGAAATGLPLKPQRWHGGQPQLILGLGVGLWAAGVLVWRQRRR